MKFIEDYNIGDFLKEKTLITLSAGNINICKEAICTKDEDLKKYFKETKIYALEENGI